MMSGKLGNVMSPLGVRLVHLLLLAAMVGEQIASKHNIPTTSSLHIVQLYCKLAKTIHSEFA